MVGGNCKITSRNVGQQRNAQTMSVSAIISVERRIQAKVPDTECLYLTCVVSELWPWLSGPWAIFSSCCLGRGGPSPASLFPPLLPAASPSIHVRCLLGTFISSLTENDPFDIFQASEQSQPLEESDKPRCPCWEPCSWKQGSGRESVFL